jgi:hypothetical protein
MNIRRHNLLKIGAIERDMREPDYLTAPAAGVVDIAGAESRQAFDMWRIGQLERYGGMSNAEILASAWHAWRIWASSPTAQLRVEIDIARYSLGLQTVEALLGAIESNREALRELVAIAEQLAASAALEPLPEADAAPAGN